MLKMHHYVLETLKIINYQSYSVTAHCYKAINCKLISSSEIVTHEKVNAIEYNIKING